MGPDKPASSRCRCLLQYRRASFWKWHSVQHAPSRAERDEIRNGDAPFPEPLPVRRSLRAPVPADPLPRDSFLISILSTVWLRSFILFPAADTIKSTPKYVESTAQDTVGRTIRVRPLSA